MPSDVSNANRACNKSTLKVPISIVPRYFEFFRETPRGAPGHAIQAEASVRRERRACAPERQNRRRSGSGLPPPPSSAPVDAPGTRPRAAPERPPGPATPKQRADGRRTAAAARGAPFTKEGARRDARHPLLDEEAARLEGPPQILYRTHIPISRDGLAHHRAVCVGGRVPGGHRGVCGCGI